MSRSVLFSIKVFFSFKDWHLDSKGFTFIEMIFVVLLLSTLAVTITLNFSGLQDDTVKDIVQIDLKVIRSAARTYYLEKGQFPNTLEDLNAYFDELPNDKYVVSGNQPYQLRSSDKTCTVWSVGKDGVDDNANPIKDIVLTFGP